MKKKVIPVILILLLAGVLAAAIGWQLRRSCQPERTGGNQTAPYPYHWQTDLLGRTALTLSDPPEGDGWQLTAAGDEAAELIPGEGNRYDLRVLGDGWQQLTFRAEGQDGSRVILRLELMVEDGRLMISDLGETVTQSGTALSEEGLTLGWTENGGMLLLSLRDESGCLWQPVNSTPEAMAVMPLVQDASGCELVLQPVAPGAGELRLQSYGLGRELVVQLKAEQTQAGLALRVEDCTLTDLPEEETLPD